MTASLPLAAGCNRCPALAANRRTIAHGYGDPQPEVMFVGEAPGYLGADRTGVPFTGDRSGRRVQALLIALGLSLESDPAVERPRLNGAFVSNVVRCNPPGNRNPTVGEVANCSPYLWAELEQLRPRVVVTMGGFAARWAFGALLGQALPAGIRELHGRIWTVQARNPEFLLCLVHPARASNRQLSIAREALSELLPGGRRSHRTMSGLGSELSLDSI